VFRCAYHYDPIEKATSALYLFQPSTLVSSAVVAAFTLDSFVQSILQFFLCFGQSATCNTEEKITTQVSHQNSSTPSTVSLSHLAITRAVRDIYPPAITTSKQLLQLRLRLLAISFYLGTKGTLLRNMWTISTFVPHHPPTNDHRNDDRRSPRPPCSCSTPH
jgi:hypothetical protein